MRNLSALPIDDDILDRIFTFLPDFKSLRSCILVSSAFHKVYAHRRKSICRQVASNFVGPVDAAMDIVRLMRPDYTPQLTNDNELRFPVQACLIVPEITDTHDLQSVSLRDIEKLESLSQLADRWEDDFCLRWKDRRGTVLLTPPESLRFRRAVYRLVLFHNAYNYISAARHVGINSDILPAPSEIQEMFQARVDFLNQFSKDELHQIQAVATYMTKIRAQEENQELAAPDEQLSHGPGVLYRLLSSGDPISPMGSPVFESNLIKYYFFVPLRAALESQGFHSLSVENHFWGHILHERFENNDPCAHCGVVEPLWNQSNWALFTKCLQTYSVPRLSDRWINKLLTANVVYGTIGLYFSGIEFSWECDPDWYFSEAFTHRYKTSIGGDFADWTADQWTCEECLGKILNHSFTPIWRARFRAYGKNLPAEDCSYGWECWKQVFSKSHAACLNHFCKPTKNQYGQLQGQSLLSSLLADLEEAEAEHS